MTISDVLKLAKRWWWLLVALPMAGIVAGYLITTTMTPVYRASATLLVQPSQLPGSQNYQDLLAAQQQSTTYSRLVTARPVLEETISRLGLHESSDALAAQVSAATVRSTQLVSVSATDHDPARAAQIANTVSAVFIDQLQQQQQSLTGSYQAQLDQNIADVKKQIDDTSAQIAQLQSDASSDAKSQAATLQQQLSQYQTTYGTLLQARQQMAIAAAQADGQVRVAEPAVAPTSYISPRRTLNLALGFVLGLILASGLVLVLGYLDDTVKSSADVEEITGVPALGAIPDAKEIDAREAARNPRSPASEGYRALRTNLQFAVADRNTKSIVVTSFQPGDGKTTTITNLAIAMAQGGQKVILVDADLRRPRVHKQFERVSGRLGLSNLLFASKELDLRHYLQPSGIENLSVVAAGPTPPNPPDILNSARMRQAVAKLEEEADIVLFDAPPLAVTDPLILVGLTDGALLVTRAGRARTKDVGIALRRIATTGQPILGVVLNRMNPKSEDYYYDGSYYGDQQEPAEDGSGLARPHKAKRKSRLSQLKTAG